MHFIANDRANRKLILIILALVVSGGIFIWQKNLLNSEKMQPVNSVVVATEVVSYVPVKIPSETKEGYCWINSLSAPRKGAWRCMVESSIHDPCFVISGSSDLVCDSNPITGYTGFLLKLTQPLPADVATNTYGQGQGWLIQLDDGTVCRFLAGATSLINNKRINYACSDNSYIIGNLEIGVIWKAEKINNLQSTSTEIVSIKKVWQ